MATIYLDDIVTEAWTRFEAMRRALNPYDIKKDLVRMPRWVRRDYEIFRRLLKIDKRLAPKRVREEFSLYKQTALKFKSLALSFDLEKTGLFDQYDKYKASNKRVATVTTVAAYHKVKGITDVKQAMGEVWLRYKTRGNRLKIYLAGIQPDKWLMDLPHNFRIQVNETSYTKNGFEFYGDYLNKSADWEENLAATVNEGEWFIYEV